MKAADLPADAVAIIGMGCRLPGAATPQDFWRNLINGVSSISAFPREELDHCHAAADPQQAAQYVSARSLLEGEDLFDAEFFGIYPKQAALMDPQHRIFLECAWEALESAGYEPERYKGLIGLYAGLSLNTYLLYNLSSKPGFAAEFAASYPGSYDTLFGNDKDFLTTRVAHKLNLRGPCVTVQTACSTSLVAVAHAYYSLLTYQCDMALAGGVSITFPQKRDYLYQSEGMLSQDGTCRTFDAASTGTVFGSGAGVVVLKRATDALADGDHIHALILGAAMNNDGSARAGYAAPGQEGQAAVIHLAQSAAGVDAESISYIEAHGTGTPLGDPIEISALTQAFRQSTSKKAFCAVGTAKTHVGHLDIAAGITGLIKTVLQLEHEKVPALLHYTTPNPRIPFADSPFYPVSRTLEWPRGEEPRRAGVSAFGVGGTNVHVVVQEAPLPADTSASRSHHLLLLSARTPSALDAMTTNLGAFLETSPQVPMGDVAFTLKQKRLFPCRRAVVVSDAKDAVARLKGADPKSVFSGSPASESPRVVFVFPGQGSQYVDMGRELYTSEPAFREAMDRCATILQGHLQIDLRTLLYPTADDKSAAEKRINETVITQPAIFAVEYALAQLWISWGVQPSVLIGHSIGEYVACVIAEVFTLEAALGLLAERAKLMQALPPGSMMAVRLGEAQLREHLPAGVSVAAINSGSLTTVSGPTDLVVAFQKHLDGKGIAARLLATSHAFHSSMMDPLMAPITEHGRRLAAKAPKIPCLSTCTGTWMTESDLADGSYWFKQLRQPVRFSEAVTVALAEPGAVILEVGPGQALSQIARQHLTKDRPALVVSSLGSTQEPGRDLAAVLAALGKLWIAGFNPLWAPFYQAESRKRVPLPTYPFERKSHWIKPTLETQTSRAPAAGEPAAHASADTSSQAEAGTPSGSEENAPLPLSTDEVLDMQNSTSSASSETRGKIVAKLRTALTELSGMEISDHQASFTELGFDSLFLTQASQALQSKFGVKITFRQMLGELSSINAIAAHIEAVAPPDTFKDPAPAPVARASSPAPAASAFRAPAAISGGTSPLEVFLSTQTQLMQMIMAQQQGGAVPPPAPAPAAAPAKVATDRQPPVKWPRGTPPNTAPASGAKTEFKRFGPYKPIEKGEKGGLTSRQQKALDDLISRYTRKSAASKKYTTEHRAHFADPRAVSGFKSNWKEMVYPIVAARSKGSKIWDLDGIEYVDITMGFGTYFFGHSPEWIHDAIRAQLEVGMEIGPQSPLAGKVAALVCEFTGMDRAAFCNTGSEAVMAAMRLSRTVTGKNRIVYFTGDYHGMFEEVLVRGAWVDGVYRAQPIAPGIPASLVENILVLEYGQPESLEIIKAHANEIAAVMVEPVQSRSPTLQPHQFLRDLRELTTASDIVLVFDEVVTGFRCHPGGAQAYFGINADLATYGKVVGGGLPIGVLAGSRRFMDALDGGMWQFGDDSFPEVGVTFFAGTFVRHPLVMATAYAVLNRLKQEGPSLQAGLNERIARLSRTLNEHFEKAEVPIRFPSFSAVGMIEHAHDLKHASLLWYYLREKGIHVWEGRPCVFTLAHADADLSRFIQAFKESVVEMQEAGFLPESSSSPLALGTPQSAEPASYPAVDSSPATESQREIFFSVQMGSEANCAYNEASNLEFHGDLDSHALEQAFVQIVQRHPSLRSTFSPAGDLQLFSAPTQKLGWAVESLEDRKGADAETAFNEACRAETATAFNLVDGPLLRLRLFRFSPELHKLLFTVHHIVCDGWSIGMIVAELGSLYTAAKARKPARLPRPMPFGDYARSLAKEASSPETKKAEEYWVNQYSKGAPVLELPTSRPRPIVKSYAGAMETLLIDPTTFASLKKTAPKSGGTLFSNLLATFATLLHRLTGQNDLVVGIPAAGQVAAGCNELVGHCLNFLPVRLNVEPANTFAQLGKTMKQVVLDAYDHQQCTFGTLVQKLKLPRDTSRLPLVSVMFNIDRSGFEFVQFDGLTFEVKANPKQWVNFELFFNLVQTETSLEVECEYNTDLFDRGTIKAWLQAFESLIAASIAAPETRIDSLPLLAAGTQQALLKELNSVAKEFPRTQTAHRLFEEQAVRNPTRRAVEAAGRALTYAELDEASNRLAAHLRSLGAGRGLLVGLCVERSVEMVVGLLGILKSGAAYVPMDPAFPAERLAMMIEDAATPIIVTQTSLAASLPAHTAKTVLIDKLPATVSAVAPAALSDGAQAEDLAYVIFTSGSTGRPKGVQITHRSLVNFLHSMRRAPGLTADDVLLSVTTLSFDIAGLELYLPLTSGGTVVVATRETTSDGNLLRRQMEACGATVMQATPATWRLLLEAGWTGNPKLKILIGGEAVPRELVNQLAPRCASLWNMYGPTETTIWSTVGRLSAGTGPVSIGRPIDNTQVYIVSPTLQLQPIGVPGELLIGGEGLARGYLKREELTAEKFIRDPFSQVPGTKVYRTGDLARWNPDGSIECLGRIDHQVKLRGFRIELGEIETALEKHPAIEQAVVVLREDTAGQKRLVAYLRGSSPQASDGAELRKYLAAHLPDYMIPSLYIAVDQFPMTANQKVNRLALPAPEINAVARTRVVSLPRNPSERLLVDIWRQVLGRDEISLDDDVFDLGADSILIFQMTTRASNAGIPLTPAMVFRHRTIAALSAILGTASTTTPPVEAIAIKRVDRAAFRRPS